MRPRSLLPALAAGSVLLGSACTGSPTGTVGPSGRAGPTWRTVALPDAVSPVTLASDGTSVVVGARAADRPNPRLFVGTDASDLRPVDLTPRSPYAFEARWFQVVTHEGRVDAVGGVRGGAHGNYRWTTWSGDAAAVAEQEQPFGVFGSYGAGDLAGLAYAGTSPVILGAWQSERTGLDIAVWTRTGARWARQPSAGTSLASTPDALVAGRAITSRGDGLVISGSVTRLSPGSVRVDAAVWTAPGGTGPWSRVDLPRTSDDELAEAHAATCTPQRCLVAGSEGGRLALWELVDGSASRLDGIPDVRLPENVPVPAPVRAGKDDVVVVPTGSRSTVLRHAGGAWSSADGPGGTPVSAVVRGDDLWVVTDDAHGAGTLSVSRVA
ncbi:hypothetical protein ACOCJ4_16610 [Knoellia sp. CPCC 206435]|uniref:hypothetical protein n=1 Tax=Knoellia terrae TaxID=3404797 RepID=UPI003B4369C5